jgi:phospholipid/cholesterol/gamma-HCH transport system substrate-binding protein
LLLRARFDDSGGLRMGAPVSLQGVAIGNVTHIRVVPNAVPGQPRAVVEVTMKVGTRYLSSIRKDTTATLSTAGVLGETFVNLDSTQAQLAVVQDDDVLPTHETPGIQDVISSTAGTLDNVNVLLKRVDAIVSTMENGKGSLGKFINDPQLYDRLNASVNEVNTIVGEISSGRGSIGKLIASDEFYTKAYAAMDKLNGLMDEVNAGQGTIGQLVKNPALYNNANETIAKANRLVEDVNAGKGALGKFAKDEEFARKLDNTITNLSKLSDQMEAGQGSLGKALKDPSLYNNTDKLLVDTQNLLQAIRENPKKYLTIRLRIF